jgi:hypothetical protein
MALSFALEKPPRVFLSQTLYSEVRQYGCHKYCIAPFILQALICEFFEQNQLCRKNDQLPSFSAC